MRIKITRVPSHRLAIGGVLQTNGTEWGQDGLTEINAGGTHEQNPNEGVQMGVAPDGSPNLVEQNETIFNDEDYVFSNRIKPKKEVLKKFHMYSKGGKLTYADVSKRLEKEAKERPNDPISKASLKDMLTQLMEAQEQQKAEEEAKKAREAFEALSPEEQQQVLAQIAQQQQNAAAMQQPTQPSDNEEVPVDENGNPIEQPQEQMPSQEDIAQGDEGSINAYGGKINKFEVGGPKQDKRSVKERLMNNLGLHTESDWNNWLAKNNVDDVDWNTFDWNDIKNNKYLLNVIAKANPVLANAIGSGYDFGVYTPNASDYDLAGFAKRQKAYNRSLKEGYLTGNYAIDDNFIKDYTDGNYKDIKDYEASDAYKKYTDAMVNTANAAQGQRFNLVDGALANVDGSKFSADDLAMLNAMYNTAMGTKTAKEGKPVPLFVKNDDGTYSIAKNAKEMLVGADGKSGLRYDGKGGIFHLDPEVTTRGANVINRVKHADGTIEDIVGDVPEEWGKPVNTYTWNDEKNSNTINYYNEPVAKDKKPEDKDEYEAIHRPEWLRYAGLFGPAVGLGLQGLGVGKPNTKGLDAAMEYASQANGKADYMPIGDYLRYNPMDIWAQENRNDANARATDRAIVNNNTTAGSKMAGLLANGYNSQLADANLFRQAQEYNDAQRQKVAEFNRGTNMFNAEAYNRTSQTNAELQNRNAQFKANLAAQTAAQKMAADAQWANGIYGNVSGLFQGISDMGRENAQHNMIADMAANSLFGTMTDKTPVARTFLKKKNKSAKGGKLKRRRGLTF